MLSLKRLRLIASLLVGTLVGVGFVTFDHAEGLSYLSTDPAACANCHIMEPQYASWQKRQPSRAVAGCVDCHLPASRPRQVDLAKADNGWTATPRPSPCRTSASPS